MLKTAISRFKIKQNHIIEQKEPSVGICPYKTAAARRDAL